MVGHNGNEGILFTDSLLRNLSTTPFAEQISLAFPTISQQALSHVVDVLYPINFDGAKNYTYAGTIQRQAFALAEYVVGCNANSLDRAFEGKSYGYLFDVPPAIHGQDLSSTFFGAATSAPSTSPINATVAEALQDYILSFTMTGLPTAADIEGVPKFQMYGKEANILDLQDVSISEAIDPAMNARCLCKFSPAWKVASTKLTITQGGRKHCGYERVLRYGGCLKMDAWSIHGVEKSVSKRAIWLCYSRQMTTSDLAR